MRLTEVTRQQNEVNLRPLNDPKTSDPIDENFRSLKFPLQGGAGNFRRPSAGSKIKNITDCDRAIRDFGTE